MKYNMVISPRDSGRRFVEEQLFKEHCKKISSCQVCKYLPYHNPDECYKVYRKGSKQWVETETKKHR